VKPPKGLVVLFELPISFFVHQTQKGQKEEKRKRGKEEKRVEWTMPAIAIYTFNG
jgi:hypothetical protein